MRMLNTPFVQNRDVNVQESGKSNDAENSWDLMLKGKRF